MIMNKRFFKSPFWLLMSCSILIPVCVGCSSVNQNKHHESSGNESSISFSELDVSNLTPKSPDTLYILIFHSDNDKEDDSLIITLSELQSYILPKPEKEGHTFDSWCLDKTLTQTFGIDKLIDGENHLYAKYNINTYNIYVHKNDEKIETLSFEYDEIINLDVDYGEHYRVEWYYYDSQFGSPFDLTEMPAHNIDLYPLIKYIEEFYSLVFHTNSDEQFDNITLERQDLETYLLPTPTLDGYVFDDWYLDSSFKKPYDIKSLVKGNNDLFAKYHIDDLAAQGKEIVYSTNRLDLERVTKDKALTPNGREVDFKGLYTDFIHVKYGERVVFGDGIDGVRYMRFVTAYDSHMRLLPNKGDNNGTHTYIVPHGVVYIRLSVYYSNLFSDSRINISETLLRYEPYCKEIAPLGEGKRRQDEYNNKYRPFTTTRVNELQDASYKPLGELKKPYFCLISDDGLKEEATYSIPMAISKGVPMTLGLMKGSEILQEPYLTTLRDAVTNHGFEVAQHGWTKYTAFTEDQLNYFFDLEKEYFDSMGFETKTAICPAHAIDELVSAVASQRFEALRTGYIGNSEGYKYGYGWYANGPTSNLYALDCINISTEPLKDHKNHIDDACANNWLMIGFYHENELDDEKKAKIEAIIDYAKEKGMEFCTLQEVPYLSNRD